MPPPMPPCWRPPEDCDNVSGLVWSSGYSPWTHAVLVVTSVRHVEWSEVVVKLLLVERFKLFWSFSCSLNCGLAVKVVERMEVDGGFM